ncbi:unnamed protein product, partial [Laminaria digitata]
ISNNYPADSCGCITGCHNSILPWSPTAFHGTSYGTPQNSVGTQVISRVFTRVPAGSHGVPWVLPCSHLAPSGTPREFPPWRRDKYHGACRDKPTGIDNNSQGGSYGIPRHAWRSLKTQHVVTN